ncbi:MAG: LysM peptidoglycan-binding domain-containing protein [Herbiconiux sp.]|uniref:LysM peptidoglycan-binding domain-containing protein n=1 Tax=Herbiconiux sp. TaxID=1871186 RepID=UPI00120BFB98|nr:LysM peptidoglycan-binding domain-containing protein [Herbiconiux sp.]TAJ49023.1 MAG: LysM peptidoglycan-binding domain-containing protein [Herbiconiux sp.]
MSIAAAQFGTTASRPAARRAASTPAPRPAAVVAAPRLRITSRGRKVLAVLIALPVITVLGLLAMFSGGSAIASLGSSSTEFDYVTVQAGQSLWSIAETVAPSADPRDVIAEIRSLNQLETSSVQPGQRIAIPADLAE